MRNFVSAAAAAVAAVATLTACGSSSSSSSPPSSLAAPASSSPSAITAAQGTKICQDLAAWSQVAQNEDQPRFTQTLTNDTTTAGDSQLGQDMTSMANDLQSENSLVLEPGPPGSSSDAQILAQDCSQYGVPIPLWSGGS